MRNLLLGGFLTAIVATLISWLLTNDSSPFKEYLLWHPEMPNRWARLNIPSYIIGAIASGSPHGMNEPVAYTAFFIQWMLVGIVITATLRLFVRPRPQ